MEGATVLKILGGAAVVSTLFAFKKKGDFTKVIENMTMDLRNIRKLHLSGAKLYAVADIGFHNPTQYAMTVKTAGLIQVKEIRLFYKGILFGIAKSNTTSFELPAKSNYLMTDIQIEIVILNLIDQYLKNGLDSNVDNYQIHTIVEALGKTWVVEQ
ncbi:hypothetical protein [Flavobacterium degerlachei]|jgi:hypothetical protein|uniref:Uncharacterized protein n=1 Tax=Flavobacterium degerlachei TaxID=229203 RepID=A0A1H3B6Y3_9FLAO|nr:hypothetical protein [Flavobacterium degerlachei]SDX37164.1 hypothetical protein SAMN05444338_109161 [Flavobacterium degerlachei]